VPTPPVADGRVLAAGAYRERAVPDGCAAARRRCIPAFIRRYIRAGARRFASAGRPGRSGVHLPLYPGGCTPVGTHPALCPATAAGRPGGGVRM